MQRLTFTNATLIDIDAGARRGARLVVADGRIADVSFSPGAPSGDDPTIDLQGRFVLPGLFNCHYHASYFNVGPGSVAPGLEAPPALQALRAAGNLRLALDAGFTGVVSAGGPHAIDAALKQAIEEGAIQGPRLMAGSRDVSTTGHKADLFPWHWPGEPPGANLCDGPEAFQRGVRQEVQRGAEIIKLFLTTGHGVPDSPPITMELSREELAVAIETAHQRGAKVRGHIANRAAILTAVELGIDLVDHGDGLDEVCIDRMLERGVFLAPSMLYPHRVAQAFGGKVAEAMKPALDHMLKVLPLANKAGLKIVLGDDFGATPLNHGDYADELDFYVNVAGIPPLDVLRWATTNGAQLMERAHELGALKPGFLADLIVVDGDPIADIRVLQRRDNVVMVMKDGRFEKNLLSAPRIRSSEDGALA